MITLKEKDALQHQILVSLDNTYTTLDEAILWFNGSDDQELSRLWDVRDLCKVCKDLCLYNSRSTRLVLSLLISELKHCPEDIIKLQTSSGVKPELPGVIKELLSELSDQTNILRSLSIRYERFN